MMPPMTMQADSHYRKPAESFLTLGWVVRNRDPKYWLSDDPKPMPGKQHADDLVCIPAHLMAAHTAIIAQSGSGKSFFLGRLVEELMLQTSAKCLILDPNADFRRIHETKEESLWKKAEYDRWERKGVLPHEATCDDFMVHWGGVVKRILTRDVPANDTYFYRELKISWLSLSMDFLAEDLDPTLQSDLYYCHGFVKAFKKVFKFVHGFADKDFLSEAQSFCRQIRELKEKSKGPQRESKRQPESNRDQLASIRYQLRKRFNEELINA